MPHTDPSPPALCRDCAQALPCGCGGRRVIRHPELFSLTVAHIDCDAFYASVEKRFRPELLDKPVIVGGGVRGVVSTACYIARLSGVKSAMPMFKARALCPDAVVIKPDFAKYNEAARQVRRLMGALTPLMAPLSIDEAVLDLAGTETLHGAPPAIMLARFANAVEAECGITVSIGLARNRLLAKLAAERGKPRGFTVLGSEAAAVLAPEPVGILPGIGPAAVRKLASLGITRLGQLQALPPQEAARKLGKDGAALAARARGEDSRLIGPARETKSVSAETTFNEDIAEPAALTRHLLRLAEKLGQRLREQGLAATGITLKLKTAGFQSRTRAARLPHPSVLPETLFAAALALLEAEADGRTRFRLIGIGSSGLAPLADADPPDLADPDSGKRRARQSAIDALRARFGAAIVQRGRLFG
jgi:DNA polymerase-4